MKNQITTKIINNINPIEGVTAEQLYTYCQLLIKPIMKQLSFIKELDIHQVNQAINDTVLYTFNKMQLGEIDKYNFNNFKNYIYVGLTNNLKKVKVTQSTHSNQFNSSFISIDDDNEKNYHDTIADTNYQVIDDTNLNYLFEAIQMLKENDRIIINSIIKEKDYFVRVLNKFGKDKNYYVTLIKRLKKNVQIIKNREYYNAIEERFKQTINKPNFDKYDDIIKVKLLLDAGLDYKRIVKFLKYDSRKVKKMINNINEYNISDAVWIRTMFIDGWKPTEITEELKLTNKFYVNDIIKHYQLSLINTNKLLPSNLKSKLINLIEKKPNKTIKVEDEVIHPKLKEKSRIGLKRDLANDIKKLRAEGKTYNQIKDILQCSKSTINYHLTELGKIKTHNRCTRLRALKKGN